MASHAAHASLAVCGDDGEGLCGARTTGFCGGLSEAGSGPKERLDLGGDRVGSSCPWPPEEHPLSRPAVLSCPSAFWCGGGRAGFGRLEPGGLRAIGCAGLMML